MTATTLLSDNGASSGTSGYKLTGGNDGTLQLQTTTSGGTATTAVTIDTSQNVGIGTPTPSGAKVQIVGDNSALRVGDGTRDMYVDPDSGGIFLSNGSGQSGEGFYLDASGHTLRMYTSTTERARIDSSGNFLFNSGYGSVATAYGCRAWVNFNGTGTVAIRNSGNVSSITDNGVGDYTVNFANALPDVNYSTVGNCIRGASDNNAALTFPLSGVYSTSAVQIRTNLLNGPTSYIDPTSVFVNVFR